MSFREKSAWITFVLLLLVFGFYFANVAPALLAGEGRLEIALSNANAATARKFVHAGFLVPVALLGAAIVVGEIVLHIIIAALSPKEANAPQDERERLIALKAKRPAFYVLSTTAFLSIAAMCLGGGEWALANGILFAIWLGELTNYGAQIYFFRRGG